MRITFADLQAQPRRLLNSPMWSGSPSNGRAYAAFTYNVERLVPWRTLTGRQHFYLDHPGYIAFGEHLPTYKPKPLPDAVRRPRRLAKAAGPTLMLNYLTPHGKWHIHSTYGDNLRMMTLSRGCEPFWMNDKDADAIGIEDNDWVEVYNDNGVVVTRAARQRAHPARASASSTTRRSARSRCPKSPLRGNRRAGGHNSLTRVAAQARPAWSGGYGQFTYHFNYWGPIGCNRDTHRASCASSPSGRSGRPERTTTWTSARRSRWCSTSTSASAATPAASPARTSGPTARAPSTCGGTTSRPSPAPAIPTPWEDQEQYRGGWEKDGDRLKLQLHGQAAGRSSTSSTTRTCRRIDDYYEPWTYHYEDLFNAPGGRRPADGARRSR